MSISLKNFVEARKNLFWDVKLEGLSEEAVFERILNFGDFDDIKKYIEIVGKDNTITVFERLISTERINIIHPEVINYFILKFDLNEKFSSGDIIERAKKSSLFHRKI